jgi:hypothetical protein
MRMSTKDTGAGAALDFAPHRGMAKGFYIKAEGLGLGPQVTTEAGTVTQSDINAQVVSLLLYVFRTTHRTAYSVFVLDDSCFMEMLSRGG